MTEPVRTWLALAAAGLLLALQAAEPPLGLAAGPALAAGLGAAALGAWAGWGVRQAWLWPRNLRRAEALWDRGGPPEGVEALLNGALAARGETGYRVHLLRGRALLAQDRSDEAWATFLHGALARLPLVARWRVAGLFRLDPGRDPAKRLDRVRRALGRTPDLGRLWHLAAALRLREDSPGARAEGLTLLARAVERGAEDPPLLEDALRTGLSHGDDGLAAAALAPLLARHQDPRLAWDRAAGAALLLRRGLAAEAAALAAQVGADRRRGPELWALEAAARRALGDLDGADAAVAAGLERHPKDFRLWMESHALALEDGQPGDAFADLEEAGGCLDPDIPAQAWEWDLRRAEFAWWIDGDAETAAEHLERVPAGFQGDALPPLRLVLKAARGGHAEVLEELQALEAAHPDHPDLRFLRADCLAGMGQWKALEDLLEGLDPDLRGRSEAFRLRGLLCAGTGRPEEARDALESAAALEPDRLRLVLDAGHACADLGEWDRAEAHWRQALRIDGACEEALLELSEARLAVHDGAGAVRLLRECLNHHPDCLDAQMRLAELEAQ